MPAKIIEGVKRMLPNQSTVQGFLRRNALNNPSYPSDWKTARLVNTEYKLFEPGRCTACYSNKAGDRLFVELDGNFHFQPWCEIRTEAIAASFNGMAFTRWLIVTYESVEEKPLLDLLSNQIDYILVRRKEPDAENISGKLLIPLELLDAEHSTTLSGRFNCHARSKEEASSEIRQCLDICLDPKLKGFPRWLSTSFMKTQMAQAYLERLVVDATAEKPYKLCEGIGEVEFPQRLAAYVLVDNTILYRYSVQELLRLIENTRLLNSEELLKTKDAMISIAEESHVWHLDIKMRCSLIEYASCDLKNDSYHVELHSLWAYSKRLKSPSAFATVPMPIMGAQINDAR